MFFTKMQGLGNDFVIIETMTQRFAPEPETIQEIADRHYGIGADQVLLLGPAIGADHDFTYRIFNADGSEAEQCGNGARCVARFLFDRGFTTSPKIRLKTVTRVIVADVLPDGRVKVDMGAPVVGNPEAVAMRLDTQGLIDKAPFYELTVACRLISFCPVSMGNPCAVIVTQALDTAFVETVGRALSTHAVFAAGANIVFVQKTSADTVKVRVFERGAGETLACGTGSSAAAAFAVTHLEVTSPVMVQTRGGELRVDYALGQNLYLTGPAGFVFNGSTE